MAEPDVIDAANPGAAISVLSQLPPGHTELPAYYRRLLDSEDEVLRVGAMCALIEGKAFSDDLRKTAIVLSRYGAVRTRIFGLLMDRGETSLARDVLAVPFDEVDTFADVRLRLRLAGDDAGLAVLEGRQFLRDGNREHLRNAMLHAEAAGGWRAAVPWNVRAMMIMPVDGGLAFHLLHYLNEANQLQLLTTAFQIFERGNLFPTTREIFNATLQLRRGNAQEALRILSNFRQAAPVADVQAFIEQLRAKASEALGDYRQAYRFYANMNETRRDPATDRSEFYFQLIRRSEAYRLGSLERDPRTDCTIMLGFARSGTTLLANILGSHPDIEALDEKPSLGTAVGFLDSRSDGDGDDSAGRAARQLYYEDLDRYRSEKRSKFVVDKNPMYSAYAGLLKSLFPEKRHIFVIRDPRDVVVSCFKQDFAANPATENFRTFAGACRLYDFVMSRWFAHFTLDDESVCYTRYDKVVTDFNNEVRRILEFLGADWDPAVLSFAEAAQNRQALTASYQKIRQGLRIGVQSQWQTYRFLFNGAKQIEKWVDFFGYEAT